jgi:hypothetical protein
MWLALYEELESWRWIVTCGAILMIHYYNVVDLLTLPKKWLTRVFVFVSIFLYLLLCVICDYYLCCLIYNNIEGMGKEMEGLSGTVHQGGTSISCRHNTHEVLWNCGRSIHAHQIKKLFR